MKRIILVAMLAASCATLTPDQQQQIDRLREGTMVALGNINSLVNSWEQARQDLKKGTLTQEQYDKIARDSENAIKNAQALITEQGATIKKLEAEGIPNWQTLLETYWPIFLGTGLFGVYGNKLLPGQKKEGSPKA